jgi:hypothetical protein
MDVWTKEQVEVRKLHQRLGVLTYLGPFLAHATGGEHQIQRDI